MLVIGNTGGEQLIPSECSKTGAIRSQTRAYGKPVNSLLTREADKTPAPPSLLPFASACHLAVRQYPLRNDAFMFPYRMVRNSQAQSFSARPRPMLEIRV